MVKTTKKKAAPEPGATPAPAGKKTVRPLAERKAALAQELADLDAQGRERAAKSLKRAKVFVDKAAGACEVDLTALQAALGAAIESVEAPPPEPE